MRIPFLPGIQRSVRRRLRLGPVDPRSRVALDPIRGEILGHDQLPVRARDLARADLLDTSGRAGASILGRLAENERILTEAYRSLIKAVRRDEAVSPAAEWLLDNFHLVEEQIREARESLPRGYQKQLPRLRGGEHDGEFRVFGLAWEYVAHTDSRFDPATVEAFVEAYQAVVPLSMGELWAIPSAIRLVLVENLRRLAQSIVEARNARVEADEVADAVREVAEAQAEAAGGPEGGAPSASTTDKRPLAGPASRLLADPSTAALAPLRPYDRLDVQRDRAFVVELIYRLRQDDPRGMPAVKWLDERLTRAGVMSEELVRQEHASQVAAQATVANIVTSLRMIAAFDWAEFFEDVSLVERILRREDSGVYPQADFATRDGYRHAVEELARGSGESEDDVARRAVAMAGRSAHRGGRPDERARYLGYHLLFDGRREFEKALGYRRPLGSRLRRAMVAGPYPRYFGALVLLILVLLTLLLWYPLGAGVAAWKVALLGLAALVPASELAIAALHQDVTELVPPRRLPKLELAEGVPEELATLVAVPVLLGSPKDIARQVERLEERYLANPEGHVAFALLTDWQDADAEHEPGDEALLGAAAAAILDLNARYGPRRDGRSRFLLLHRRRVWSERERRWMGWDRKRGKLMELNRLLRGRTDTTYLLRDDGLTDLPPAVRFVITLDSDTLLPPGAARRLIGAAAHPLNRPRFDEAKGRVTAGYGILQPRVTALLPEAGESSRYHRLFAGPTGIDPYSSASSDVYQDLFGEGTFVGKGIYDVDAFQASLEGRIPEGALLSHDHFEGAFARSGLVTDIEVFDDFPTSDEENARRIHRWARGDWQLLPWLIGRAPPVEGRDVPPRPPFLARWKMFDNLRRTLASPSSLLLLVIGWFVLPLSPWLWSIFVVATIGVPVAVPVVLEIWPRHGRRWRRHVRSTLLEASRSAARVGLAVAFLPRRAWLMVDAIFRTLWRMYVTGRNLQEWMPAAQAGRGLGRGIAGSFRRLAPPALTASFVVVGIAAAARPAALPPALVLAAIWAASPLLSWWLSRPLPEGRLEAFSEDEALELRRTARESWRFFERYVTAEDNWLPPDNYQEDPDPRIAHRTSPTNVGLYLLSVVSARDLGWIGTSEAAERIERTMNTVEGLERFRGHLLNWYDTRSLAPLPPRYVSTVDSGNLAGHLLAMAEACREFRKSQVAPAAAAAGIADAVRLVRHAVGAGAGRSAAATTGAVEGALRRIEGGLADPPAEADEAWAARLRDLFAAATELERAAAAAAGDAEVFVESAAESAADRSLLYWARAVRRTIEAHLADLEQSAVDRAELARSLAEVAKRADKLAREMDFTLLYDPTRKLLSIGYRPEDDRLDESYYDLLASEARVASLVAIATGDIEIEHWFHLGRGVTRIDNGAALVSWSGSMFEYLMPYLIMGAPPGTLLAQTRRLVVERQMEYGKERGVPWGVSESAYNGRDLELTYQYSYFGVPGLGLARGLSEELVIAPYATALAAMVRPKAAVRNLRRLDAMGARGEYGFYESVDFSPARLPAEGDHAIVRAHMAHHQGMTVTALANVLTDGCLRERFHRVPMVRSFAMLLQERTPRDLPLSRPRPEEVETVRHVRETVTPVDRRFTSAHPRPPATHLLSNGHYSVMLTTAGGGYSRSGDLAVTRWREDTTRDCWGSFIYLRDVESGDVWSTTWQPTGREPNQYEVVYSEGRADFRRRDGAIATSMEVLVSPEMDGELRRVTLRNLGSRVREIELTSYAEIVLVPPAADIAHPAFQKLFVQTELDHSSGILLATRRRRSSEAPQVWASHVTAVEGDAVGVQQHETDRGRFLGRGHTTAAPSSVAQDRPLSGTTGPVLDPIFSLRRAVRIKPGQSARVTFTTLVANSREEAVGRAEVHRDPAAFERAAALAWTQAQVQLQHLGISPGEAHLFQRLASRLLYLDPESRAPQEILARNERGQTALWPFGISGDRPFVVVRIDLVRDRELVRQLVRAHEYWGWKGLDTDLVILNERPTSYADELEDWIQQLVRVSHVAGLSGHRPHGDIYVLRSSDLGPEDRVLLLAAARVEFDARGGSLSQQLEPETPDEPLRLERAGRPRAPIGRKAFRKRPELQYANGLGGFAEDGREYVITLGEGQSTPAPWLNVIANSRFGFQVSEAGSGFTWSVNSRENRLTPWSNDPVVDPPGEVFYVRDEATGDLWTPTSAPIRHSGEYRATHSQGWSRFEHESYGILTELTLYVPTDDPVKIACLRVRNVSGRTRRLSVTSYAEWVLGVDREAAALHVKTELDPSSRAIFARNTWNRDYAGRVAFADLLGRQDSWTADRTEFLGRNGSVASPAALQANEALSGTTGAGLDPCAALQRRVTLAAGEQTDVVFLLGQGENAEEARSLVERYRRADLGAVLDDVRTQWDDVLGTVQVDLPDKSMEPMLNRWLLYQTLSCRVFARSAFYQSGGAYGFRDQLQDFMALVVSRRDLAREHLLRAAGRQFPEGDVQHWWHPPSGKGVRTLISDDLLWLPFGVLHYLEVTGDDSILEEEVPFLAGAPLGPDEHERYFEPEGVNGSATLYEHCARALDARLATGAHGLPLMGTGDWNDGMDRVGVEGKGESVWMGWFLHMNLSGFAPVAERRGDARAGDWRRHAGELEKALERHGWDGNWYRRAYFDDGTPLGSAVNEECRIDSIAQSWAVLSGVASPARRARAMQSMEQYLVRRGDALVLLFTPPFDDGELDPGYIREYLPGVRENGGQYTHAAIWSVLAFAEMGRGDEALELFSILNPVNQTSTRAGVHRYKVEPYVSVADVYAEPPHTGRGGWSWYTGSAGWMYRAGIEWILGFRLRGDTLRLNPCIPRDWRGYRMSFRYHSTRYEIEVANPAGGMRGVESCSLDGQPVEVNGDGGRVPLVDDGGTHTVRLVMGAGESPASHDA